MYKFHGLRLRTKVLKSVFPFYVFPFVRLFSSSCSLPLTLFHGGLLGLIFAGYVPLASQSPYPTRVYSVANYRPHLVTFGQICNFRDPRLAGAHQIWWAPEISHFLFLWIDSFFTLNEKHFTLHLQYKHSGTFANWKYEEQSYPEKSENVRPHSSNSIENATSSSGTSPLAIYG